MRFARVTGLAVALYVSATGLAKAGFLETFDSGSASFTANEPFWLDQTLTNGWIVQSTGIVPGWGNNIWQDVGGTGYFLFDGTGGDNPDPTLNEFYIGPVFSVVPDTFYTVSFYLTNGVTWNAASVQPEIDGSLLGAAVSATGWAGSDGWQQFSFSWNSGSNTSASLILHNYTTMGAGNDLGVDDISVEAAAPEPGTLSLMAGVGLAVAVLRRKRGLNCPTSPASHKG